MPPVTHVFVKVPDPAEGETPRTVPVPANEGAGGGGALLLAVPGKVYRLPWSTYTRRRLAGGDFVLTTISGGSAKTEVDADASSDVRMDPDGHVDPDQRTDEEIAAKAKADELKASKLAAGPALQKFDTSDAAKGKV